MTVRLAPALVAHAVGALSAILIATSVHAMDIAGVKLEPKVKVVNSELVLNGAGIRKRVIVNVYIGALYLQEKKSTGADAVNLPGAKRMHLQMLREVSGQQFVDAMKESVKYNTSQADLDKIASELTEFYGSVSTIGAMKAGDVITLDLVPNSGLVTAMGGKQLGKPIASPDLFKAILRIFIGDKPVDEGLKKGMFGS